MKSKRARPLARLLVGLVALAGATAAAFVAAGPAQAASCSNFPTASLCTSDVTATATVPWSGPIAQYSTVSPETAFSVSVIWGDGTNSEYDVTGSTGGTVTGSHTYTSSGTFSIQVQLFTTAEYFSAYATATVATAPPTADLGVTVNAPGSASKGSPLIYQILPSNAGPDTATNVVLTDHLPYGTAFQSVTTSDGWSCNSPKKGTLGATITCTRGQLQVGEVTAVSTGVTIKALPNRGPVTNTVAISGDNRDLNTANNTASVSVTVTGK